MTCFFYTLSSALNENFILILIFLKKFKWTILVTHTVTDSHTSLANLTYIVNNIPKRGICLFVWSLCYSQSELILTFLYIMYYKWHILTQMPSFVVQCWQYYRSFFSISSTVNANLCVSRTSYKQEHIFICCR